MLNCKSEEQNFVFFKKGGDNVSSKNNVFLYPLRVIPVFIDTLRCSCTVLLFKVYNKYLIFQMTPEDEALFLR